MLVTIAGRSHSIAVKEPLSDKRITQAAVDEVYARMLALADRYFGGEVTPRAHDLVIGAVELHFEDPQQSASDWLAYQITQLW